MRIAIDMRSVAETGGQISGVENYFVNIFNRLSDYIKPADNLMPIINRYKKVVLPDSLVAPATLSQTHIPNKVFNSLQFLFHYPRFENLYGEFDVLWLPDIRPFSVNLKTKVALTVHDLTPLTNPEYYSLRRRIWHRIVDYRQAIRRADIIFAVSEYTKQDIINKLGVDSQKIKVVYPGVETKDFKPLTELDAEHIAKVKSKYLLPDEYILALSTIEPRKNIANLIVAFEALENSTNKNVHLVIAGKLGWLYEPIIKRIKSSALRDRIHLLGYIHENDKAVIIAAASLLCYPSFHEGFGFQPIEAMACGVPVVASSRTSLPEICGGAAILVEPNHPGDIASAIESLLNDSDLRQKYITLGLIRSRKFDWQNTAKEVYDGCMTIGERS